MHILSLYSVIQPYCFVVVLQVQSTKRADPNELKVIFLKVKLNSRNPSFKSCIMILVCFLLYAVVKWAALNQMCNLRCKVVSVMTLGCHYSFISLVTLHFNCHAAGKFRMLQNVKFTSACTSWPIGAVSFFQKQHKERLACAGRNV